VITYKIKSKWINKKDHDNVPLVISRLFYMIQTKEDINAQIVIFSFILLRIKNN